MQRAARKQTSGLPTLSAKIEERRREHAEIRANCARQSKVAIDMRKAAAGMRTRTKRQ